MTSSMISLAALLGFVALSTCQCPNEVAIWNPNLRTQTANETWFLVPINSTAVTEALAGIYGAGTIQLADVPRDDTTLFPAGFDDDKHPVLVSAGLSDDIRMSALQIDGALLAGAATVPYVKRPQSKAGTVLSALLNEYIAGPAGMPVAGVVPATVSTLVEGESLRLGQFVPESAAYQLNGEGVFSNKVAWDVLPNPISGPGFYPEALDLQFTPAQALTKTTPKLFKAILNQPLVLNGEFLALNQCQRNQYYFNNATSVMMPREGNVTLGPAIDGAGVQLTGTLQQASPGGFFADLEGFSACGQVVGNNAQDCDVASQDVDPAAL